jgi:hypothetical protein
MFKKPRFGQTQQAKLSKGCASRLSTLINVFAGKRPSRGFSCFGSVQIRRECLFASGEGTVWASGKPKESLGSRRGAK